MITDNNGAAGTGGGAGASNSSVPSTKPVAPKTSLLGWLKKFFFG